jgi:hypothetical protein
MLPILHFPFNALRRSTPQGGRFSPEQHVRLQRRRVLDFLAHIIRTGSRRQ